MDFIVSAILSGVLYDLIKTGVKQLTINLIYKKLIYKSLPSWQSLSEADIKMLQELINQINSLKDEQEKIDYIRGIQSSENKFLLGSDLYPTDFAERLDYIIYKINSAELLNGIDRVNVNIERLGEFLGLESVNDLKKFYESGKEPSYFFLDSVAKKLGVVPEWMKSETKGELADRYPFKTNLNPLLLYGDWQKQLREDGCFEDDINLYFAMTDYTEGEGNEEKYTKRWLLLVRQHDSLRFDYYPTRIPFYYDKEQGIGKTSETTLVNLYRMLIELRNKRKLPEIYCLTTDKFEALESGFDYPGAIKSGKRLSFDFLEDFLDIGEDSIERSRNVRGDFVLADVQEFLAKSL